MKTLALFLLSLPLFAIGSAVQSTSKMGVTDNYVVAIQWTGDAIDGTVPAIALQGLSPLQGFFINSMESKPMTPAPTNGYTITLTDAAGVDILGGLATPISSTTSQSFLAIGSTPPLNGTLTVNVTGNSVASAKGTIYVFLVKPGSSLASSFLNGRYFRIPVNYSSASVSGISNSNGNNVFGLKSIIGGLNPQTERLVASNVPGTTTDGTDGGVAIPSNSTQLEGKAIFGAATNASTTTNVLGGQFFARAAGAGTSTAIGDRVKLWGLNTLVEDGSPLGGPPYTGYDWVYLTNEYDFNVFNSKTQVIASSIGGVWSAQPQTSYGYVVNSTNSAYKWDCGFCTLDATASVALQVGVSSSGNNAGSQPSILYSRDSGAAVHGASISTDPDGNFLFRPGFTGPAGSNEQSIFQGSDGTNVLGIAGSVGGAKPVVQGSGTTRFQPGTTAFADLSAEGGGASVYCSDCNVVSAAPHFCTGGGGGAMAFRSGGQWKCPF